MTTSLPDLFTDSIPCFPDTFAKRPTAGSTSHTKSTWLARRQIDLQWLAALLARLSKSLVSGSEAVSGAPRTVRRPVPPRQWGKLVPPWRVD